jgi:hypothetical protein
MRFSIKGFTWLAISAFVALTMTLAVTPQAGATVQRGCPTNAFCIYAQNAYWDGNRPSYIMSPDLGTYYDHQWWNLKNQVGTHKVFTNTDSRYAFSLTKVTLNRGYNGGGPVLGVVEAGKSYDLDLTEVNSVTVWWDPMPWLPRPGG